VLNFCKDTKIFTTAKSKGRHNNADPVVIWIKKRVQLSIAIPKTSAGAIHKASLLGII